MYRQWYLRVHSFHGISRFASSSVFLTSTAAAALIGVAGELDVETRGVQGAWEAIEFSELRGEAPYDEVGDDGAV
jgi:hypothetical protein